MIIHKQIHVTITPSCMFATYFRMLALNLNLLLRNKYLNIKIGKIIKNNDGQTFYESNYIP